MLPLLLFHLLLLVPNTLGISIGEPFPQEKIPKVFQANILTSNSLSSLSTVTTEYFDGVNKRGSIITWDSDQKTQTTFRVQKDGKVEFFTVINDAVCTDQRTEDDAAVFLKDTERLTLAYAMENFLPDWKLVSENQIHMGIKTSTFQGSLDFFNGTLADAEMSWDAGDPDWQFPNCPNLNCSDWWVPLKLVLTVPPGNSSSSNETFVLTYVFYDYKESIDDPEVFQVPRGVYCNLLEERKPFPTNLPIDFEAGLETYFYNVESTTTVKERVFYNMDFKIIRADIESFIEEDPNLTTEIRDFNTNVVYDIHKNGSCNVRSMYQWEIDLGIKEKTSLGLINFFTHNSIKELQGFIYVGQRNYRDWDCDVWMANLEGNPVEIYLTNRSIIDENGKDVTYAVPLAINSSAVIGSSEHKSTLTNFFDVDIKTLSWERFETALCFPDQFKMRFQIELKGPYYGAIELNLHSFVRQMQSQLATFVEILPYRFQEILVDHLHPPNQTTVVLFTATLVEDPYNAGKLGTNVNDVATNAQVYEKLDNKILTDQSGTTFTFKTALKDFQYRAVSIRNDIATPPTSNEAEDIYLSYAKIGQAKITKGVDFETSRLSRMECFDICSESTEFECKSWSYCKAEGTCSLSAIIVEEKSNPDFEYKPSTDCELYTRDYVKDYVVNRETVTEAKGDEVSSHVEVTGGASECARKCSLKDSISFYCEGFDICEDSGKTTCYFRPVHILEMDPSAIKESKTCNHYTRDYIDDFLRFGDKTAAFKDFSNVITTTTDVKNCARLCSTSKDVNACKAFEMCKQNSNSDKKTQCRILDSSKEDAKVLYNAEGNCDHYKRNHFLPDRNKPINPDDRKPSGLTGGSEGYSSGDMAGLAFGMIFLGLLIGGIVVVGIMKYKVMQR